MSLLMKNIQLDKMAPSRRYTAEEAAELLAFTDDESDISESEIDEKCSEEGSESIEDETVIVAPIPLEEIVFQASPSSPEHVKNIDSLQQPRENNEKEQLPDLVTSSKTPPNPPRETRGKGKSTEVDVDVDTWTIIEAGNISETTHNFDFRPKQEPGVAAHINGNFEPIDCFFQFIDDEVLGRIVKMINSYAKQKCQINNPAKRRSMMASGKPVTKGEVLR